jgi:glycosyltransferase involved in cell wall biosynthesis
MRVLVLTKIFPNRLEPSSSPFNRQQFAELSRLCELEIMATIPWFPGAQAFSRWSHAGRLSEVPAVDSIDGLVVHHPRFVFVPKIGHGFTGPLYAASLAKTALRHQGRVDVVFGSWAYPDGFAAVVLGKLLEVPVVVKLHGSDMNVVANMPGPRRCLKWALPRADRIVAVSDPLRQAAIDLGAVRERVDVVPNGIDRKQFRPRDRAEARRRLGIPANGAVVLYVGNIELHKGVLDLINAVAALGKRREVSLVMVGGGSRVDECRRLSAELGAGVEFPGRLSHDEVPQWLAACDVLALPSWNEGTPNVVLEALASGRRVVATRVGGTPNVVTSPVLGELVPPRDSAALAEALERALHAPYDPERVSAALDAPDWAYSAERLYESLGAALSNRASEAA